LNASRRARHDSGASANQRNAQEFSAKDAFMTIDRRTFLAAASGLVLSPAFAEEAPPALAAYERETGGRIGLYAENLASGTKMVWRAEERFVMCSTFKASLAAFVLARIDRGEDQLSARVSYGEKDCSTMRRSPKRTLPRARCRYPTCARPSSSSATIPAPISCWRALAARKR
jgi:beta-lactamase class A